MLIHSQMRFLSSQLASTLLWVKMWWAWLEPPAASLVLASPMLLLALDLTILPGRKRGQRALAAVWEHCHIPQDSSQRHVGTDGRAQCCTSTGYGLAVVCELTANGHVCLNVLDEVPATWWFRCCEVLLQSLCWGRNACATPIPQLWLWFLRADNGLQSFSLRGMKGEEGKIKTGL